MYLWEKQREFVENRHRFSAFIGGVRSGKTYAGTVKGIRSALARKSVGCVVAPTYTMVRDVILPLWRKLLPSKKVKKFSETHLKLWLKNGSVVLFRSAENPERLYGLTLNWFHLDESAIMARKVWDVMFSRVISTKGKGFFTTTPSGRNWVWQLTNSSEIFAVYAKTSDNPLIDRDEIERARRTLDPKFFRQQYEASFEAYLGQVYDDFSEKNIMPWTPGGGKIYVCADFGWRNPTAILWAEHLPDGKIHFFEEVVESYLSTDMIVKILLGREVNLPSGRIFQAPVKFENVEALVTGFEATQSRQESSGLAIVDILRNSGISQIRISAGPIINGIFAVRAKILSADNKSSLFVDPHCNRLISDFRGYHYPDSSTGDLSELPEKDGIHDHTMDAVRYLVTYLTNAEKTWLI